MTSQEENSPEGQKTIQTLEEICENTSTIRSIVDRILDHLQEHRNQDDHRASDNYNQDTASWEDFCNNSDTYM